MIGFVSLAAATMALAGFNLSAPVQIEGAVKNPGPVAIQAASPLKTTVQLAGGFSPNADLRNVQVRSANGDVRVWNLYQLGAIATVNPGDVVTAPVLDPTKVVFVDGAVVNRAPIDFRTGITLSEVIALSVPASKDLDRVIVERGPDAKKTTYKLDKIGGVTLMPGDKVTAPYARSVQTSDKELITILVIALAVIVILR